MKISTKGRYGLRLMVDIALHQGEGPVSLRDVGRRQDISEKYLEQLVPPMVRAGYLKSVRGASGGYLLTRSPSEYTAGEIIRTQEGPLAPVECVQDGHSCGRIAQCATADLYRKIWQAVNDVVDSVTLQDLLDEAGKKNAAGKAG